ncbi:haloacid dehalogenase [Rhodobacterales bacterium 56_14_T64]|nr:haloacid dehalogenase [Rhodobacterales bacterium 56_14_T64]
MPKTHPTPKLVIFDCDGVLVDSEVVSNLVLVENLAQFGLQLTVSDCMTHFVGGTMKAVMGKAQDMGADLPPTWVEDVYQEIYAALQKGVPLVAGIPALLATLDQEAIPCCVASNGGEEKMRITLGQNDLWERFHPNAMFSAHTLGVAKPDPGLFLAAASHFDVQARDCVVVEDSATGAMAASRAGMRCLGYAPEGGGARLAEQGAEVFSSMAQVSELLGLSG